MGCCKLSCTTTNVTLSFIHLPYFKRPMITLAGLTQDLTDLCV